MEHNSVIIYRNRSEAELDRLIWENPDFFFNMIVVAISAFLGIFLSFKAYKYLYDKIPYKFRKNNKNLVECIPWFIAVIFTITISKILVPILNFLILM